MKFESHPTRPNEILTLGDSCYVSYNPSPCDGISIFKADHGSEETAIVMEKDGKGYFLILNGDFRQEMLEAAQRDGIGGCLAVYNSHPEDQSSWSSDKNAVEGFVKRLLGG